MSPCGFVWRKGLVKQWFDDERHGTPQPEPFRICSSRPGMEVRKHQICMCCKVVAPLIVSLPN